MLILSPEIWEQIQREAAQSYPLECCGLLAGDAGEVKLAKCCYPLRNSDSRQARTRYMVDPAQYLNADKLARSQGLQIIGIYHSHPDHPPQPSSVDLQNAWPEYSYLIISLPDGRPAEMKSWVLAGDMQKFEPETLEVR